MSAYRSDLHDLLDPVERGRFAAYRRELDRHRFALGAVTVRRLAAAHHGVDPAAVVVDRGCPGCGAPHGRPRVTGSPLRFSVTHSGELVGVAIADGVDIGLDVERQGRDVLDSGIVRTAWAAGEAEPSTPAEFFRVWTRKESVVKATGDGLGVGLASVVVTGPGQAPAVLSYAGRPLPSRLFDLQPRPDHPAALCVLTTEPVVLTEFTEHASSP